MPSKYKYTIETDKIPTKYIIYKAISPSNKLYIGLTCQPLSHHMAGHNYSAKKGERYAMSYAIRKYGIHNFKWYIIDYANDYDKLKELEQFWISYYQSNNNKKGYNLTKGGDGTIGYVPTQETKDKQKLKRIKYLNDENLRISLAEKRNCKPFNVFSLEGVFIGNYISKVDCSIKLLGIANRNFASGITQILRNNTGIHGGYIFSYENTLSKDFLEKYKPKPFVVYDFNYNYIGEYSYNYECERDLNLEQSAISRCLSGESNSHKGYIFIYKNSNDIMKELDNKINYTINSYEYFNVYDLYGKFIGKYNNQTFCAKELNIYSRCLSDCLNHIQYRIDQYVAIKCNELEEYLLLNKTSKIYVIYKKNKRIIGIYNNVLEISQDLQYNLITILKYLKGELKYRSIKKYDFVFEENLYPKYKLFTVYDKITGGIIKEDINALACSEELGIDHADLCRCLNHQKKYVKSYIAIFNYEFSRELLENKLKNC